MSVPIMATRIINTWIKTSVAHRTFGGLWYPTANAICSHISHKYNLTVPHVVAVLSALSPRRSWERNVIDTETVVSRWSWGGHIAPNLCTKVQANKIWDILTTQKTEDILALFKPKQAPKTRAFYLNVLLASDWWRHETEPRVLAMLPSSCITIDRHAIRVAWGPKAPNRINYSTYQAIEAAYVRAFERIRTNDAGVYPSDVLLPSTPQALQATVWLYQRQQGRIT